jgi:hypothetical protein
MRITLGALAVLLAFGHLTARADPLQSAACISALQTLNQAEETAQQASAPPALRAGREGRHASLAAARRAVAQACLGTADGPAPALRYSAPVAVERIAPAEPKLPPPLAPAAPPPRQEPLHMITVCDAGGCWTSDGTRLQRQGSLLLGPRGHCSSVGAVLNCP